MTQFDLLESRLAFFPDLRLMVEDYVTAIILILTLCFIAA